MYNLITGGVICLCWELKLMRSNYGIIAGIVFVASVFSGCAYPISSQMRQQVDPGVSLVDIFQAPEAHAGIKVILGGVIVAVHNSPEGAEIEVIQKDLDSTGYPRNVDRSLGRFLFRKSGFLEPQIYKKGRQITGAGAVLGVKAGKIGEADYSFPVIDGEELRLLETYQYNYDPYPYYWGGYWGPYYPGFYYPRYYWWGHRHHHH